MISDSHPEATVRMLEEQRSRFGGRSETPDVVDMWTTSEILGAGIMALFNQDQNQTFGGSKFQMA